MGSRRRSGLWKMSAATSHRVSRRPSQSHSSVRGRKKVMERDSVNTALWVGKAASLRLGRDSHHMAVESGEVRKSFHNFGECKYRVNCKFTHYPCGDST